MTAAGLWAGAGIFFSLVTLPTLFMNMDTSDAGRTAALLFPGYYAFGLAAGAMLLVAVAINASFALDPMVLTSLNISWARKSSFLPIWPPALRRSWPRRSR